MALFVEMIVVPYFWICLFPLELKEWPTKTLAEKMLGIGDHTMPFATLFIEFVFISGTPFVTRHFIFCGGFGWVYLIFNCIYTITTGTRIYEPFKWNSVGQFIGLPVGFTIGGALLFTVAYYLARFKLRKLGHTKIYNIITGKKLNGMKVIIE